MRELLAAYLHKLPPAERPVAALHLMADNMEAAESFGRWLDRWAAHPRPTMNEPEKALCWLTPNKALHPLEAADMA